MVKTRLARAGGLLPGLSMLGTLAVIGCGSDEPPPTAGQILPEGVDYAIHQMRTFVTREGIRRALVEADTAEFHGESEVHLRPMTLTFYDEDGRESTVVTSDFGVYYELTEDLDARGSVVALDRTDGQRLETEKLRYVNAEDRLCGDTTFRLFRDRETTVIDGSSFESDPSLDSVIVINPQGQTERPVTRTPLPPPRIETAPDSGATAVTADDSLAVEEGAAAEPIDTTAAPDSLTTSDTTSVPPDTLQAPPDTASAPPGTPKPGRGAGLRRLRPRTGP